MDADFDLYGVSGEWGVAWTADRLAWPAVHVDEVV